MSHYNDYNYSDRNMNERIIILRLLSAHKRFVVKLTISFGWVAFRRSFADYVWPCCNRCR